MLLLRGLLRLPDRVVILAVASRDDPVDFRQVYPFLVCPSDSLRRAWLGAKTLGPSLNFVAVLIVGLGQSVCQVVPILLDPDRFDEFLVMLEVFVAFEPELFELRA